MLYSWFFIILIIAIIAIVAWAVARFKLEKSTHSKNMQLIAHTDAISALPEYKNAEKKYRRLLMLAAALFLICATSTTALAARPVSISEEADDYDARDIMICVDVSGSMSDVDTKLLEYLSNLTLRFQGQRIGITLFNGAPVLFSPLSNDYEAVSETLKLMSTDFDQYARAVNSASVGIGVSQISSSTISCINNFDKLEDEERSRALILVTDNYEGNRKFTLTQVAEYAIRYNIVIYGINRSYGGYSEEALRIGAENDSYFDRDELDFYRAAMLTGGDYQVICVSDHCSDNNVTMEQIVTHIMDQEATRTKGAPQPIRSDTPSLFALLSLVSFCLLILVIWRLKL